MKIEQLKLINRLDRAVFIIEEHTKQGNVLTAVSNRQVVYEHLINTYHREQIPVYIWKETGRPMILTSYNQLVRHWQTMNSIKIFAQIKPGELINYTLHRLPLFREL